MKQIILACSLLVLAAALLGCEKKETASSKTGSEAPNLIFSEEAKRKEAWPDSGLPEAFTTYWEAALQGRFQETYLKEAAYVRQLIPKEKYVTVMNLTMDFNKMAGLEVSAPRARSRYLYEVPLKLQMKIQTPVDPTRLDYWVKTESGWHHAIKPSLLFPELGFVAPVPGKPGPIFQGKEVRKGD